MLADILGSQKPSKYVGKANSLPFKNHVHADLAIVDFAEKLLMESEAQWNSEEICRIVQTCTAPQQYTGLIISECIRRNDLVSWNDLGSRFELNFFNCRLFLGKF